MEKILKLEQLHLPIIGLWDPTRHIYIMDAKKSPLEHEKLLNFKKNFFLDLSKHLSIRSGIITEMSKIEFHKIFDHFFDKIWVFGEKWSKMLQKMVMSVKSSVSQ